MGNDKRRAANGMGTIRERKDGSWEARYTGTDGRQYSIYAKTQPEAKAKLKKRMAELTLGLWARPSSVTVEAWVKTWLKDYAGQRKPSTQASYARMMKNHIIPEFGNMKVQQINAGIIKRVFGRLSKKGLSPSTLKTIKIALSSCLTAAVECKIINENPCNGIKIKNVPKKKLIFIDRNDYPAFFAEVGKHRYSTAILLMFQTGIRSSEMRGLRWSDFSPEEASLTIARQIVETDNGALVQTPKDDEERTIILAPETVSLLKRHKKQQAEMRMKYGPWEDTAITNDLIFRTSDGGFYKQSLLYYTVQKIGRAINIPGLHPHSLRDSYAIAALRAGVDIKTVSNNLGHADTSMTLNKYIAYTDDMGRVAAERYAKYLRENS